MSHLPVHQRLLTPRPPRAGGRALAVAGRLRSVITVAALSVAFCAVSAVSTVSVEAQGIVYPGVGPVNRSMAGAAVAAPLDAAGALHWNPGALSGLAASELNVGVELHMHRSVLQADAPADAFQPGSPALSSRVGSHTGATLLPSGSGQSVSTQVEYPMIVSVGAAYSGVPRLLLAVDVRYINFSGAKFFGDSAAFRPDRSLAGLGWRDSTATALGCQYQWSNASSIRVGYGYGQSPVSDMDTAANLQSGEFWNHMLTMGTTIHLTGQMSMSVSYVRTFDKSTAGPIRTADGVLAGSLVAIGQRADAITTGISMQF